MKHSLLALLALIAAFQVSCNEEEQPAASSPAVFTTGQSASVVMGQTSFTANTTGTGAAEMTVPVGVALSASNVVLVAEQNNSRVLVFNSVPTANGASANTVLGQSSFTGGFTGSTAPEMSTPQAVAVSGSQVFVADWGNHRATIFNSTATGASASFAIGQTTTGTGTDPAGAVMANTLRYPQGIFVSGSKVVIADGNFNRVLLYNTIPSANNASANVALGQANKTSGASGVSKMSSPSGVWTDGTKIVVCDMNNHRVLIWNSWPSSDGTAPDVILGQSDLTTNTANNGGIGASTLSGPSGVASNGTELFIADTGNNRILYWSSWPTTNKQTANKVLGQSDFTTSSSGLTAAALNSPRGMTYDGTNLFVADASNNRVLIFKKQ